MTIGHLGLTSAEADAWPPFLKGLSEAAVLALTVSPSLVRSYRLTGSAKLSTNTG